MADHPESGSEIRTRLAEELADSVSLREPVPQLLGNPRGCFLVPCEERARLIAAYVDEIENYRAGGNRRKHRIIKVLTRSEREHLDKTTWERCEEARITLARHRARHGCK
jgi:hypothetical protein